MDEDDLYLTREGFYVCPGKTSMARAGDTPIMRKAEFDPTMTLVELRRLQAQFERLKDVTDGASESVDVLGDAMEPQGTYYTDDEFQEAMETAEVTGELRGYGKAIDDVIAFVSDNVGFGLSKDFLIKRIRELRNTEEG